MSTCQELGHVMRPADTRVSGRRGGLVVATERSLQAAGEGALQLLLLRRSVRTVGVVVLDELTQHRREVAPSGDQQVVEALAAQCADEAFGDRVGPRRAHWGADDADVGAGEDRVEGEGEHSNAYQYSRP